MLRLATLTVAVALIAAALAPPPALGAGDDRKLRKALNASMKAAGGAAGAMVYDLSEERTLYALRARRARMLASNTKLFTTAAALDRFGSQGRIRTNLRADAPPDGGGAIRGNLYLRGAGDPSFGSASFNRRAYGAGAPTVERLARRVKAAGVSRVTGTVVGDETVFDSLRGGPASNHGVSYWVGPLSGLAFNRGLGSEHGSSFQSNPPQFAAQRLVAALRARGVRVGGPAVTGPSAPGAVPVTFIRSLPMARLAAITNKRSDNFFAEILAKRTHARGARAGTTAGGAAVAASIARRYGAAARLVDGSGLSRANRGRPRAVVRFLRGMRSHPELAAFEASLPVAGQDGTLANRMKNRARGRCRAKTGTLTGVSALSGYCTARSGDTIAFSILMNGVPSADRARRLQDRMAAAIVRFG